MELTIVVFYSGVALIALGLFLMIMGFLKKERCMSFATGKVVGTQKVSRNYLRLTVSFVDGGVEYTLAERIPSHKKLGKKEGDDIDILYNPEDPKDFFVQGSTTERNTYIMCIVLGLALCVIGEVMAYNFGGMLPFVKEIRQLVWWIQYRVLK